MTTDTIKSRLETLHKDIDALAKRSGRDAREIKVVLVTKTVEVARIQEAYDAGARDFGENKPQELLGKIPLLPDDIRWHMIGNLQTNKVKRVAGQVAMIQSVDRAELFWEIEKRARLMGKRVACLLQVDNSGEPTKAGFRPEDVAPFLKRISQDSPVSFEGLMAIGPHTNDAMLIKRKFEKIAALRNELSREFPHLRLKTLSMGMSSDYQVAIEAGSNMVRVGSIIFGRRAT